MSPIDSTSDQIRQPGMNRTSIRLPGRFDMKTIPVGRTRHGQYQSKQAAGAALYIAW